MFKISCEKHTLKGLLLASLCLSGCKKDPNSTQYLTTISTGPAQRKTIVLPDSSTVILNAESYVTYATKNFKRSIQVDGNVYVIVNNKANTDFVMTHDSMNLITKDAEFNYDNSEAKSGVKYVGYGTFYPPARLTVINGSLEVNAAWASGKWKAGYSGTVSKYESYTFVHDSTLKVTWIHGYYDFTSVPFGELCRLMSRMYALHVYYDRYDEPNLIGPIHLDITQSKSYLIEDSTLNSQINFAIINDSTVFAKALH
ncbi:hypothetical protein DBR11_04980 [Pedobacter sp. HMWF019]|uniref:FecR domain-containing protein n=1 Tax=Pedobacter sp. HMWF019 TaxID=2056856 RepID=UPI000D354384|nr:FecR family protein [Pedobacter sp. HMWF019]PTT02344.1 hypothetical protein DBR11_04980 [Pedobacter sp. HMWF019]